MSLCCVNYSTKTHILHDLAKSDKSVTVQKISKKLYESGNVDFRALKIIDLIITKSSRLFCVFNIKSESHMKDIIKISIKMYTSDTFSVHVNYHSNKIGFRILNKYETVILLGNIFKHDVHIDDINSFLSDCI